MAKRAFRFGVISAGAPSRSAWIALAQRAEELGYSSLLVADILGAPLATISALAVAATATTRLRVGSFVFVNDYRHPALLAREIATLDQLTDGRVELGMGLGTYPLDFQQLGIPFDQAGATRALQRGSPSSNTSSAVKPSISQANTTQRRNCALFPGRYNSHIHPFSLAVQVAVW